MLGDLFPEGCAIRASVGECFQVGREVTCFVQPVEDHGFGSDDECGVMCFFAIGFFGEVFVVFIENGEDLDRLTEAHVVGEDAAHAEPFEEFEPSESVLLVGAKFAIESLGGLCGVNAVELSDAFAGFLEFVIGVGEFLFIQKGVEEYGLCGLKSEVVVFDAGDGGEKAVLLEPFGGEHAL